MKTITDRILQETAIEDIKELEEKRMEEGDYIANVTNRMLDYTIEYIKIKFELK